MSLWHNKKVLVTGANGFVGSHLVKALIQKKAQVITLDAVPLPETSLLCLEKLDSEIKSEIGSILDYDYLLRIVRKNKIETIFHLAAKSIVEIGQGSPINTFEVNIKGTWNILEAARITKVKKIIIASSAHVYGNNPNVPYRENYFTAPSRPYETSKACADLLAQSYADTYKLPVEIPRFVNIYGPADFNFTRVVPKVILSVLKNENPKIWDVGAVRDFLYIDDGVNAYLKLAETDLSNEKRIRVFNFGSGHPVSIVDVVKKIVILSPDKKLTVKMQKVPGERSGEVIKQYVSITKAKSSLGWQPQYSLDEGLKKTFDWYQKFLTKKRVL